VEALVVAVIAVPAIVVAMLTIREYRRREWLQRRVIPRWS
jgi:hypothetical protein